MLNLPRLPAKAAYIHLDNASKRNALSLGVLLNLQAQLKQHLTSPTTGRLLTLPTFQPSLLEKLSSQESAANTRYHWLVDASEWQRQRGGLPNVLVLRSQGPVFSSGHDLKELAGMSHDERLVLFNTCAEVMALIRRSPAIVVCAIQGLATAAGFQLAMNCDIAVARAKTLFQLPGMSIGLPCTSPSTAVSRRLPVGLAYRMFATAEPVQASQLGGAVDVVESESITAFEERVEQLVSRLAGMPGQPQALGKWAYWAQIGIGKYHDSESGGGDSVDEDAARWAAAAMSLHAQGADAKEGISSFLSKKKPAWST
ncbi:enoyl-CoA hydratase/isomerase [Lasiosphaeris hirsuta]|uniref:Enoyl-CoA hydratase domain-containing protein 3, mitochondrial n=1 Tax=Lasiosphaeris hirsuta TaxID=260670 RepID=A0AA40DIQ2_9PEZI|nr:enoyl-CoA hydratase/isomerase [Lasiosphaeris hirsuta]